MLIKQNYALNGDFDGEYDDFYHERSIPFDIPNFDIACVSYDYLRLECFGIMKTLTEIWRSNVKHSKEFYQNHPLKR